MQSVTTAPQSAADDQGVRVRRYLTAMGFRLVCFVLAYFTTGWVRWSFVAGAVVLPYVAVVLANAVGPRYGDPVAPVEPRGQGPAALEPDGSDHTPVSGQVVGDAPARPAHLVCSAKGCRREATAALLWNNPSLHDPARRKVWLCCDEHRDSLGRFLSARGFLRDTIPVTELTAAHG